MTGLSALCCLGGLISIDADIPYALPDKWVDLPRYHDHVGVLICLYRRIDWLGAFLVTAGLISIIFVLSDGSSAPDGWKTGCM